MPSYHVGLLGKNRSKNLLIPFNHRVFCAFAQSMSFGTSANAVVGTLCFWRFILGVGVGGDYPLRL